MKYGDVQGVPFVWHWYSNGLLIDAPYTWSKVHLTESHRGEEGSRTRCGLYVPYWDDEVVEIIEGDAAYDQSDACKVCHGLVERRR